MSLPGEDHEPWCLRSLLGDDDWNDGAAANWRNATGKDVPCDCGSFAGAVRHAMVVRFWPARHQASERKWLA